MWLCSTFGSISRITSLDTYWKNRKATTSIETQLPTELVQTLWPLSSQREVVSWNLPNQNVRRFRADYIRKQICRQELSSWHMKASHFVEPCCGQGVYPNQTIPTPKHPKKGKKNLLLKEGKKEVLITRKLVRNRGVFYPSSDADMQQLAKQIWKLLWVWIFSEK